MDDITKALIENQAKQLKSYEKSQEAIYAANRTAHEDRNTFERQLRDAEKDLRDANQKAAKSAEKYEARIAALDADKARLLGTEDGADSAESPLAANETLLKTSQERVAYLEKRLENANRDRDYMRERYQEAQTAAGETGELRARLQVAEEEASKNKIRIHEINDAQSKRGHLARIKELETKLKERDAELDRTRDELRSSKNGRRETRQTSVPRSPRPGILSPRAPARSYPSSTSRGGSPAPAGLDVGNVAGGSLLPGMQLFPQAQTSRRFNEL